MRPFNQDALKFFNSYTFSLAIAFFIIPSNAFFPTAWRETLFGGGGVSHVTQTEQAFQTLATQYFTSINSLSKNMISARNTISQANADVDNDQTHSALHCDGENFSGAQSRLQSLHSEIIAHLVAADATSAQKSLGSALHTIQDFYAHSNYVEMGFSSPSDVLGRAGLEIGHAGPNDQTCRECKAVPWWKDPIKMCPDCSGNEDGFMGALTSGYYFGEDAPANGATIPSFKCHHGGKTDNSHGAAFGFVLGQPTMGINKDSLNCQFSPHYYHHKAAVDLSVRATMQFIEDIRQEILDSQLRMLFGVDSPPGKKIRRGSVSSVGEMIGDLLSVDHHYISRNYKSIPSNATSTKWSNSTSTYQSKLISAYSVPVDSLMASLSIFLRGSSATLTIQNPDGLFLDLNSTTLSDGSVTTISNPQAGTWIFSITTSSDFTLDVLGASALQLSSFGFYELGGRPGHEGYYPISGPPPSNTPIAIISTLEGEFSFAEFALHRPSGEKLSTLAMASGSGDFGQPGTNSFFTVLQLPDEDFVVQVTGIDASGVKFQRGVYDVVTPIMSNRTYKVGDMVNVSVANNTGFPTGINNNSTLNATTSSSSAGYTGAVVVSSGVRRIEHVWTSLAIGIIVLDILTAS